MRNAGFLLFGGLLLALAAWAMFGSFSDGEFDRSPLGSNGLQLWLEAKGVPVVRSDVHIKRSLSEVSLHILPLPPSQAESSGNRASDGKGDRRLGSWVDTESFDGIPTLIVLPKWNMSVAKDEIAREFGLVPLSDIYNDFAEIDLSDLYLKRLGPEFTEAQVKIGQDPSQKLALYRAQLFDRSTIPSQCKELVGMPAGALLIHCEDEATFYLLADPDLLNNHGLAQVDNAAFAVSIIKSLRGGGETRPVYLDTSGQLLDSEKPVDEGRTYERSATDLKRFFAYPLSVIWAAILLIALVCLWRGAYRFGPPLDGDANKLEISKTASIEATARLLRLSGNDGRMIAQFVQHLLADKAILLFGSTAGNPAGIERMFQRLARRDPPLALAMQAAAQTLIEQGHVMSRSDLHRNLVTFRSLLGSTDFGSR